MTDMNDDSNDSKKKPRGFAALTPERRRELASIGGRAAHAKGTAHEFNRETATEAGRKGGKVAASRPGRMAEIGKLGGQARGRNGRLRTGMAQEAAGEEE